MSAIALIIVGIILIALGYFLPVPSWAKSLIMAVGVICLIVGIILVVIPYITGNLFIMPHTLLS